ncbi:alkaline phosphatase family protein [Mechercharimyces sp. CAU 1602]|uniref:alkaline phosphatase family protein n=1 Tax=Mechercharimyces sp. CAU 1602 TaxID=2973933 RepID=UPI002163398E|nr:alkaline phosphatase family protein [Mechercharimyces sp. CAU 1602]MCS1351117.1 alkaline phosphatase family protein [Mechercharimyces sp. CAU 1602]
MRVREKKVMVIGLDCADPELVFTRFLDKLPHLKRLIQSGASARLRSTDPPITVPAWASMVTGKDPGQLGCYGFRNRFDYGYNSVGIVDSSVITEPTIWDVLGEHGFQSLVMGVPPTYPVKPIEGNMISCCLTPDASSPYTYPSALKHEIERKIGTYLFDVDNFRTAKYDELLTSIYEMTRLRFQTARYLLQAKEWDFFMMVEMGIDRIHHAFWHLMDSKHVLHEPSQYRDAILQYYQYVDQQIGELIASVPGNPMIMVVSDHGAKRMDGGFCINEWLRKEGYLTLKKEPTQLGPLDLSEVDWRRTKAWGYGGYYGRIHLNVKGREPHGLVDASRYERTRNQLIKKLRSLKDDHGARFPVTVFKPDKKYETTNNIPPDLIAYFGDLYWRSIGLVGGNQIFTHENDVGPDGANHDYEGIFISSWKNNSQRVDGGLLLHGLQIADIAPTVLNEFGISPLAGMVGKVIRTQES